MGTAAKVHVGREHLISFAVAKGNQMAASAFDVQKTSQPPNFEDFLEQSPRKSRGTKTRK